MSIFPFSVNKSKMPKKQSYDFLLHIHYIKSGIAGETKTIEYKATWLCSNPEQKVIEFKDRCIEDFMNKCDDQQIRVTIKSIEAWYEENK